MSIKQLIESISQSENCIVKSPTGVPSVDRRLPIDVEEFYRMAGGARLFTNEDYSIDIVEPEEFIRANPVIVGEECKEDISYDWFIIAKTEEQYITIDLNEERFGRCYDSFWDRHGVPGECQIIAESFEDLLTQLIKTKGSYWFWLKIEFENLGDAYD